MQPNQVPSSSIWGYAISAPMLDQHKAGSLEEVMDAIHLLEPHLMVPIAEMVQSNRWRETYGASQDVVSRSIEYAY